MEEEVKQKKCKKGAPIWMCTFADLMSLLLCFFVLLLSFSIMDSIRFKEVAGSLKDAFGIQKKEYIPHTPLGEQVVSLDFETVPLEAKFQQEIKQELEKELQAGLVEAEAVPEGLILRVKDSVAFHSGKAAIQDRFKPILDTVGRIVKDKKLIVEVSGHTDDLPLKKGVAFSSNWSLSAARSVKVVEYWINKYKIPVDRLSAAGYADGQPLDNSHTSEGRAKNRRVEFLVKTIKPGLAKEELEAVDGN
ncbi:MAG: OmpA family protein [Desulfobulbaceae bacterium]|nr:OmpA family protein [Desulfobulbaceae bacterium]MCK5323800.1 OmpA family protein [Desulfobulbaceae bacterium]MCK5436633.1 OmpA family protein [Desulfobulbaceae bacterium]